MKKKFSILCVVMLFCTFLVQSFNSQASCLYELNGECEFKCDSTPNETCKGEATVDGNRLRVTCDGKEVDCEGFAGPQ